MRQCTDEAGFRQRRERQPDFLQPVRLRPQGAEVALVRVVTQPRGGDGANARMLARRLAEALDATVRQNMTVTEADIEEPVA